MITDDSARLCSAVVQSLESAGCITINVETMCIGFNVPFMTGIKLQRKNRYNATEQWSILFDHDLMVVHVPPCGAVDVGDPDLMKKVLALMDGGI